MEAKVVQKGKERVLIVSVDFDGCLGHSTFTENYKRMQKELPKDCTPEQREAAFKALIQQSNAALVQDIVQRCQEYDRVVVIVGSNRQSANKDQHDAQKNKNGSCFEATDMLAKVLAEQTQKPVDLDKYLVFDSILELPAGTNFDLKQQEFSEVAKQYEMSMDKKYRLAYFQMQEACALYPDASVSYVHYDDRNDIVNDTAQAFKTEQGQHLPPNLVKATACHYELYNPYATLQSMGNDARRQANENPDQIVDSDTLAQLATALEIIYKYAESSDQIIARHQDTFNKAQEQRDALVKKREGMTIGTQEYSDITKQIEKLDTPLSQLQKPQQTIDIIKKIRELARQSSGKDLPDGQLTWLTVSNMLKMADKLLNNNLREHYLSPFPEVKAEFERSSNNMEKETVKAVGDFTRSVKEGHQMEMTTFDQTVRECMKDSSIEKLGTYGSFVAEEKRLTPIANIENAIKSASFKAEMIDNIEISERYRLLEPLKKGFIEGKVSLDTSIACLDKLYTQPEEKLAAIQDLFDEVTNSNNKLYSPPKNPVVRFLKGLGGKENYSSERLGHIARLQNEYLKIVRENKDNEDVKNHVASSTFPDWETRHLFIGINHATQCRKQLLALYGDDPNMTIQQLFTLSTESDNPFKADGVAGFIATTLLGAKRRLASFSTEQIAGYIADNPKHAPQLLAVYKDELARNPDAIYRILSKKELHDAVRESKLLDSKYLSSDHKKDMYAAFLYPRHSLSTSTPKNEGEPPIPTTPVAEVIRKGRPPLPTTPVSEVIRKGRPAPPSHAAPPPPSTAPVIPPERRPAMPTMSPTPIPEGKRPPPSHAAPSIPPSTPTVTLAGESPLRPKKPLPAIPNVENKAPAHDGPSDEEVERAMKVLDSLESSQRPGWTQESSSDTESKDRDQSGENLSDESPSSDEGQKGPE